MKKFDHIVYGAQYYRAPTPLACDWQRDITEMAACGFNTIKIWAQWRSNCPQENGYDFRDLHTIMDIAHENNIRVIVNIIMDVAPAWFCRKYPDSVMITGDGRRIEYQTIAYRQIGGAPGPCFHFPEGIEARRAFLEALAEELSDHPALLAWDLWNEPELGSGIEKREPEAGDLLCYCEHSKLAFQQWLQQKYQNVESLNQAWHQYYGCFEEVEMPHCGQTFQNMIDWRAFFADTIVAETQMRADVIRARDHEHPVMVHTVPLPYFNMVAACSDDYKLASIGDLHGNSLGTNPFSATISVSAAEGKPVISSEMQIMGGTTFSRPGIPEWKDFKRCVFVPLSKGVKGFQYWQFRPERLGTESPAWGLSQIDGTESQQLIFAEKLCSALMENEKILLEAMPDKSRVAVINASENQVFDWCASGSVEKYYRSLKGSFEALHRENFNVDIVSGEQLNAEKLKQYKMIVYPFPHYVKCDLAARLKEWVAQGGTLVSECFFGTVSSKDGLFAETVPGLGFDEVFGAKEAQTLTASVFHDPYHETWSSEDVENNVISLELTEDIGGMKAGEAVRGYYFSEGLTPCFGGQPIAKFSDGRIAAVRNRYHKGSAVLLGSLVGYFFDVDCASGLPKLLASLAGEAGVSPTAKSAPGNVRVDVLKNAGNPAALVVTNWNSEAVNAEVQVAGMSGMWFDILTKEQYAAGSNGKIRISLDGGDCATLCRAD